MEHWSVGFRDHYDLKTTAGVMSPKNLNITEKQQSHCEEPEATTQSHKGSQ